jgi:hypothetical protein
MITFLAIYTNTIKQQPTNPNKMPRKVTPKVPRKIHQVNTNASEVNECKAEIKIFQLGLEPGLYRLKQVIPTIFMHYHITDFTQQLEILRELELSPFIQPPSDTNKKHRVSFSIPDVY